MEHSGKPIAEPTSQPPAETGGDAILWAAWLYYGEALTQNDVAASLGVSRASVANYLAEARRRGLVQIHLAPDLLSRLSLGRALAARFGLQAAAVAPPADTSEDPASLRRRLGLLGAQVIAPWLSDGATLGVAWGRTVLELAHALPTRALARAEVVQISGSSLGEDASSPEACTVLIANRLGARCRNFHAPAVVSSRGLCAALLDEPALARHFARLRGCDIAVFGVGELGPGTVWSDTDFLPASVAHDYREAGSAGVLIGRFIDAKGREVPGPLSGRQIAIALADLAALPVRVCLAGGPAKTEAIRATLTGGYASHLVTDAETARRLLGETPPEESHPKETP
ncbi:MAG: sugar-binding domain-containing protein [Pseudomonadota bacterium]